MKPPFHTRVADHCNSIQANFSSAANKLILTILLIASPLFSCKNISQQNSDKQTLENFYVHKNCFVAKKALVGFEKRNYGQTNNKNFNYLGSQSMIGAISGIFIENPGCREEILSVSKKLSANAKAVIMIALIHAELPELAKEFANKNSPNLPAKGLSELSGIKKTTPSNNPAINDLLLGAYGATGDEIYLSNILRSFKLEKKEKVKHAIRVGMMIGKFGFSLSPKGHDGKMLQALKEKYTHEGLFQLTTMFTAFWAINSRAKSDENIAKYLREFFLDEKLKRVLSIERNYFENYLTCLAIDGALAEGVETKSENQDLIKKNQKLIADYEELRDPNVMDLVSKKNRTKE